MNKPSNVKAYIPKEKGLRLRAKNNNVKEPQRQSVYSKRKRIKTFLNLLSIPSVVSQSVYSKRKRIKTRYSVPFCRLSFHVKAYIPKEKGLRHRIGSSWIRGILCQSVYSKRKRIKTA